MPRLAFEEPKGGPLKKDDEPAEPVEPAKHRREPGRDTVLLVLKVATVTAVLGLVGVVVMLTTAGGDEPSAESPGVPEIGTSQSSGAPTTTTVPAAIVAPEVRSQTTEMAPSTPPPPPVTQPTTLPPAQQPLPPGQTNQFVRVGEPCDTPGAYAFTERFEPVICDGGRQNERLAWRRMFR